MKAKNSVLIDSDAWVARFYEHDTNHQSSLEFFDILQQAQQPLVTTNQVVIEVATVLSHRSGQTLAKLFLETLRSVELPVIQVDETLQDAAWNIFMNQSRRGTSFTDCANVATVQAKGLAAIFSFDKAYMKDHDWLKVYPEGYSDEND